MGKSKKIIGIGLGLAVLVSSVSFAFAANGQAQSTSDTSKSKYQSVEHFKGKGGGQRVDPLSSLVTAGTITADQQMSIQKAMKPTKDTQTTIKTSLDKMVTAGTITQAQEDAVIKAYDDAKAKMEAEQEKRLEEMAKEKGITVAELKVQMEEQKASKGQGDFRNSKGKGEGQRVDILKSLVTAGTITADQQQSIQKAMKPTKDMQITIKTSLDKMVTAGTISQAQEDAVIKAYDDAKAKMEAGQEKVRRNGQRLDIIDTPEQNK